MTSIASSPRHETPKQPHIVISDEGHIHLSFGSDTSIFHIVSTDQGKSFSEATLVAQPSKLSLGMRRGPRIACCGKSLLISAVTGKLGGGKDGDLTLWRSQDAGKTWQGPININDQEASAREGLHAMTANEKRADCVWLDLRNMRTELWHSTSTDQGATWSPNTLVYRSPENQSASAATHRCAMTLRENSPSCGEIQLTTTVTCISARKMLTANLVMRSNSGLELGISTLVRWTAAVVFSMPRASSPLFGVARANC